MNVKEVIQNATLPKVRETFVAAQYAPEYSHTTEHIPTVALALKKAAAK